MKFITLKGKEVHVSTGQKPDPSRFRSNFQKQVYFLLKEKFIGRIIINEFKIPATRLTIDIFFPDLRIAIEVDGSQHETFNPYFHRNVFDLLNQKKRDNQKDEFCRINSIKLYRVKELLDVESVTG